MTARDPITVVMLGPPVPFARMRLGRTGTHFVPAEQRNAAATLKMAAAEAMTRAGLGPLDGPLSFTLLGEFPIPTAWSKRKVARALLGEERPAKRPDLDNVFKLAADALQGIVYVNDAQIVELWCRKIYGLQPKLVITVAPISSPATAVKPRANAAHRPGELPLVVAA